MSKFKSRGQNMENRRGHNVKDKSGPKYGLQWSNYRNEQRKCVVKLKEIK